MLSKRKYYSVVLDIEKKSKKLHEKQRQTKECSKQTLLTNIEQQGKVQFSSGQKITKVAPINRGVNFDLHDKWTKVDLVIYKSQVLIDATPEYLSEYFMLRSASRLLPVITLASQPIEKILDMCTLIRNSGILVANDANKDRAKAIIAHKYRLGLSNTIVINLDERDFFEVNSFIEEI
ncbi:unnamed protein product [Rotaria sp. Silwood1]|nr:unnamed protein product [Rotaria sp. Silwood1]CAF3513241.1 unnamed protein product [Rotaria sp. Silwood1]CAF4640460.1 unnamed protein product [Rotaria sp. Silwood1]